MWDKIVSAVKATWKAVGAGVSAAAVYIYSAGVFGLDQTPAEAVLTAWTNVTSWSIGQWFGLIGAVCAAYGIVWAFPPNEPAE